MTTSLWLNIDVLTFIFVCIIWFILAKFAWHIQVVRGFLFIIGAILVFTVIGWIQYQFFADPTNVSMHDVERAKRQAVLRMRLEWEDQFQPYGCANTPPQTMFPDNPDITRMSQVLRVGIILCPGSTWLFSQPGAFLVWRDAYGTQAIPIFGAQWRLYQERYAQLGRPTSAPYLIKQSSKEIVGQDFGIGQRVVYLRQGDAKGDAWIQQRKTLFWQIPNIFCVDGVTDDGTGCWNTPNSSKVYHPYLDRVGADGDWLEGKPVSLGGWWAPLNMWRSLLLSVTLSIVFLIFTFWSDIMQALGQALGCLGIFILFMVSVVGINVMLIGLLLGFSDPRITMPEAHGGNFSMINIVIDHVSPQHSIKNLETIPVVTLDHPDGPVSNLTHLGEWWINWWVQERTVTHTTGWKMLIAGFKPFIVGEIIAFLIIPVWIGMAVAGEMGAWIGLIVEVGMIIAGVYSRTSGRNVSST